MELKNTEIQPKKTMYESQKKYLREKTTQVTMRLHNVNDADILDFIRDAKQTKIKLAVREYLRLSKLEEEMIKKEMEDANGAHRDK